MAFQRAETRAPIEIDGVRIILSDRYDEERNRVKGADYSVRVRFSDGSVEVRSGDLVPHLTQAQIDALLAFVADMWTKAEDEILPEKEPEQ